MTIKIIIAVLLFFTLAHVATWHHEWRTAQQHNEPRQERLTR